jgi:hypothetical protein
MIDVVESKPILELQPGSNRFTSRGQMKKAYLALSIWMIISGGTQVWSQSSNLRIVGSAGSPGLPVVCRIYLDHTIECEAFSFGVSHDSSKLTVTGLQNGWYLVGANLGGVSPDFLMMESNPVGGGGFIVGCLVDTEVPINPLMAGINQEIVIVTYSVAATAIPGSTPLQFSATLHDPMVEILIVMNGLESTPTFENGSVEILVDCNGNFVQDSEDIAAGTSSDCDLDGVPDECGFAAGASDCDQNGTPDICELDCDLDGVPDACAIAANQVPDCDLNGVPDACDFAAGGDQDGNGILDACDNVPFWRGDCNSSGSLDLADAIASLYFLFGLANLVTCVDSCDVNDSGAVDIADTVYFLGGLFSNGPPPLPPYPDCGEDPTADPLGCGSSSISCP